MIPRPVHRPQISKIPFTRPVKHPLYPSVDQTKDKKRMTIAAGFVVNDGAVLCTDSLYSGGIKRQGRKIFPFQLNGGAVAFALAGHEPFAKRAIEECCRCFEQNETLLTSIAGIKHVTETALKSFYEEFVFTRPADDRERVRFELLIAAVTLKERPIVFCARDSVLNPIEGYECLGAGYFVGEHVINNAFNRNLSVDEAVLLGLHATAMAKEYVDGVGGPTQILWIRDGKVSSIHPAGSSVFTESLIVSFERRAAELLFHAGNPRLSEEEYQAHAERFVKSMGFIRKHWMEGFQHQGLLEMLRTQAVELRLPTPKDGLSHQPPSPESPGGTDEF